MAFMNKGQNKHAAKASTPPAETTGDPEIDEIQMAKRIADAEQAIEDSAVDPSKRYFIMREIRIDAHNVHRFRVPLTPSMCQVRGCLYDSAVTIGYPKGWNEAPLKQKLQNGMTVEEKLLQMLESHKEKGHVFEQSHIMSEDQLAIHKNAASLPKGFLTTVS